MHFTSIDLGIHLGSAATEPPPKTCNNGQPACTNCYTCKDEKTGNYVEFQDRRQLHLELLQAELLKRIDNGAT